VNLKYYHDSGTTTILTRHSIDMLEGDLSGKKCAECGSSVHIINAVDGTYVACSAYPWDHKTGIVIDIDDYRHEKAPRIL